METGLDNIAQQLTDKSIKLSIPAGSFLRIASDLEDVDGVQTVKVNREAINKISNILNNELNMVKNVILPSITEYTGMVKNFLSSSKTFNPIDTINIDYITISPILGLLVEKNLISNTNVMSLSNNTFIFNKPNFLNTSNIEINIASVDMVSNDYIKTLDNEFLDKLWDDYMVAISISNPNWKNLTFNTKENIDRLIVLFLLLTHFSNNIPNNITVSTNKFLDVILTAKEYVSRLLFAKYTRLNNYITKEYVVYNMDRENKSIILIEETTDSYLADGGTIESILALLMASSSYSDTTISGLKENKDKLESIWNTYATTQEVTNKIKQIEKYKTTYTLALQKYLRDAPDSFLDKIRPGSDSDIADILPDYLTHCRDEDILNNDMMCENIILDMLFNHTNAKLFLSSMRKYKKLHPDLSPKETATLSVIDLTLAYLVTQINF